MPDTTFHLARTSSSKFANASRYIKLLAWVFMMVAFVACKKEHPVDIPANYSISPSAITIELNEPILKQIKLIKDGSTVDGSTVVWKSLNEQIVTVQNNSELKPHWAGETSIVALSPQGQELARCAVTIIDDNYYKIRITLKDKGTSNFSINNPLSFLSARAVERRQRQNINIDQSDLPLAENYLKEIEKIGGTIVAKSKWLKTVSVHLNNPALLHQYKALPFVADVKVVWGKNRDIYQKPASNWSFPGSNAPVAPTVNITDDVSIYGYAYNNLRLNKGNQLHKMGFKGRNLQIAVIDAGFKDINKNARLSNLHILGAKSFIYEQSNPYAIDNHGTAVLSIIAGARPFEYVGTAPEASFLLLTSEDDTDEYPIEEDYYVNALEYADSSGIDIVNTSLGYVEYDLPGADNTFEILNGRTAIASRGVTMAYSKGMVIVVAAGNSGSFVGSPADSPEALAVGMTNSDGAVVSGSSRGITADGRIKPDVIAMGSGSYVILTSGAFGGGSGTSYASPAMAGMTACLWQAFPNLSNRQIIDIIKRSSDRYATPGLPYGFGLPDMEKAYNIAINLN